MLSFSRENSIEDQGMTTLTLSLSGFEVVFLMDSIRGAATEVGSDRRVEGLETVRALVLNLSSLYTEVLGKGDKEPWSGPVQLAISDEQAWYLQAKVVTGSIALDGKTNVGIPLSLKLFEIIRCYAADLDDLPVSGEDETPFGESEKIRLSELVKGESDARPEPDAGSFED